MRYFFYLFLAYLVVGFFILPPLLKPQLIKSMQQETKTEATIASLAFNPLFFSVELQGFELRDLQHQKLFSFEKLTLNLNPTSLLYGAFELKELSLVTPKIYMVYNRDKTINLLKVLLDKKSKREPEKQDEKGTLPRVVVDKITLEDGTLYYKDYTHKTPFLLSFENIGFSLKEFDTKNITNKSAKVRFYTSLSDGGFVDFQSNITSIAPFKIEGNLALESIQLYTAWKYLQDSLQLEVADGKLFFSTKYSFNLDDINATKLEGLQLSLKNLRIKPKKEKGDILRLKNLSIQNAILLPMQEKIEIEKIALDGLQVEAKRDKEGNLDWMKYLKTETHKKLKGNSTKEKQYNIKIKKIRVADAKCRLLDKTLAKVQKHTLDKISVRVDDFDTKKRSWLHYKASMRCNGSGILKADGKLSLKPLRQNGTISAKKIELTALTPYLQEQSFLSIDDGRVSFHAKESYRPSKNSADVHIHGELAVHSLFVSDTKEAKSSLFSLNELSIHPFTLELFPNRLYIDSVDIDSFYVAAKIDENKTINFSQLKRVTKESHPKRVEEKKSDIFPLKIAKINIKNGSAFFSDLSLPIKFQTDIHDLNGVLYAISSSAGDTTYVDIAGEVDKYGSTKLQGSIDSFNPKEYTDLQMDFTNLNLHSLSGYSASFAGYEIDSGKLYLDLGYHILHSQLNATNSIVIKKIELGKELEEKGVNHLPLGLAIGLLEDNKGIVDINMPIVGDVDKPDFKYGTLIWKTVGNLIAKAVTSPFKFLGSMLGVEGEDLEFIAFDFGKSTITPSQREKLDNIAKMMQKRQKISLKIDATYNKQEDMKLLKLQKLIAIVMKRSAHENNLKAKTALNSEILENIYRQSHKNDKLTKIKEKLHQEYKSKEAFQRVYQNRLIALCRDMQSIEKNELKHLAEERAQKIQSYLTHKRALAKERVQIGDTIEEHHSDAKKVKLQLNIVVH